MSFDKQIYFYGIETDAFYTKEEEEISTRISRLRNLKKRIDLPTKKESKSYKKIKHKTYKNDELRKKHLKKLSKMISLQKKELKIEFNNTRNKNIIRELNPNYLKDEKINALFESSLIRTFKCEPKELTTDFFVIKVYYFEVIEDLILNGFNYNNEHYILFSASAGQIRKKKCVFVREDLLNKNYNTLTCGLDWDNINSHGGVNINKYLAYLALTCSATDVWKNFDIDKSIVVNDFETNVFGDVDFINDKTYEINRMNMNVPIPHTDGCGIMLDETTRMVRMPWVKGLMATFPYDIWCRENQCNGDITDIYGKKYNIFDDDIRYIFTKSQFKMWKYYSSWNEYKEKFKKYNCEATYCKEEPEYIPNAITSYQMIQTLTDITEKEMTQLAQKSIIDIENIGNDYRTMQKILGFNKENINKNYFQQALEIYPELMRDKYNRDILRDCKNSLVKNAKGAKFGVNGKYTFVLPDLYAFCEWLFLGIENPQGILKDGEVSCNIYRDGYELDCLRSPHLYREHCVRTNVNNNITKKWFTTKSIYTSTHDLITKVLQLDCDGDMLLVIRDNLFCKIAKRNCRDIVPLYYEMRKAPAENINLQSLLNGMEKAWKGKDIGYYSNLITKIWNQEEVEDEELQSIKLLCMENNFSIDEAKTLYMPTRPDAINKTLQKYERLKLPHFFLYAKDKDEEKLENVNDSGVNMLDNIIPCGNIKYNHTIGKLDSSMLLSDREFVYPQNAIEIVEAYDNCKNYISSNRNKYNDEDSKVNYSEKYWYQCARERILELPFDKNTIVDSLIYFLYNQRKGSKKKMLWECFGEEIIDNLKNNLETTNTKICPICGKRFKPRDNANTTYCSIKCYEIQHSEDAKIRMQKYRNN